MKENQITKVLDALIKNEITYDEAKDKLFVLYGVGNRFVVAKTVMGNYVHLDTDWNNDYLKKKGYEVVDFFGNRESAIKECNRLNGC